MSVEHKIYAYYITTLIFAFVLASIWTYNDEVKKNPVEIKNAVQTTTEGDTTTTETEPVTVYMGEFIATAYCPCEICCGQWATKRPIAPNGEKIVVTSSGSKAKAGQTVAVDTDVIPYGTVVIIDGCKYIAQDTGGAIRGNKIDIYFDTHAEAVAFGKQIVNVYVKG